MTSFKFWFLVACLLINSSNLLAAEKAGLLKNASGDVQIQREGNVIKGTQGIDLLAKDVLITGEKSYAGIIFTDGTLFTIGPDTHFTLKTYRFEPKNNIYDFSMYLESGTGLYQSGKISKLAPEAVSLSTPKATVGIRGTRFIIKVEN